MTRPARSSAATLVVCVAASLSIAGPLTPPAGPPASTDKTLVEVEPRIAINEVNTPGDADSRYRITQRGSYYLTSDLPIIGVRHGIEIAANDVTIDLMGFTLYSSDPLPIGSPPVSLNGIQTEPVGGVVYENITIRNGVVRGFGQNGIQTLANGSRFEDLLIIDNQGRGLVMYHGSTVDGCVAQSNGGFGFESTIQALVQNSIAIDNAGDGYRLGVGSTVIACSAFNNDGDGFDIEVSGNISHCNAAGNDQTGFRLGASSVLTDSSATYNLVYGIEAVEFALFGPAEGSLIDRCVVAGRGIYVEGSSYVRDCMVEDALNEGIRVTGSRNRVEGCHVTNSTIGYSVAGANNLIVRNTASNSATPYDISAGNHYGPIVNLGGGPAVSGASAPGVLGTTDPWANFSQ